MVCLEKIDIFYAKYVVVIIFEFSLDSNHLNERRVRMRIHSDKSIGHKEVPSLIDLSLAKLSTILNTCDSLHRLPHNILGRLLKLFETDTNLQVNLSLLSSKFKFFLRRI